MTATMIKALLVTLGCDGRECPYYRLLGWPFDDDPMARHDAHADYHAERTLAARQRAAELVA